MNLGVITADVMLSSLQLQISALNFMHDGSYTEFFSDRHDAHVNLISTLRKKTLPPSGEGSQEYLRVMDLYAEWSAFLAMYCSCVRLHDGLGAVQERVTSFHNRVSDERDRIQKMAMSNK